jgi:hypothetical protein
VSIPFGELKFCIDINCSGPDPKEVQRAKELCLDLLANVREQYEEFKSRPPPQRGYSDRAPSTGYGGQSGYGDRQVSDRSNSYGGYANAYSNSPAPHTSGSAMTPPSTGAPGAGTPAAGADYSAQYALYYGGQDPYAAYGGYAA